jgi:hypothetical protein
MIDFCVLLGFLAILLSPCFVAMATGVHGGADLGSRDPSEPRHADVARNVIPG